ncbi:EF-hand calcium-binding domain-containing protein 12 isoform X2 [Scyliorhinus torazame]|uniref:EF-hand calcium-binding domain-containing protein 12 isoform X2 n=1 Tax=Scyliorhinus torazame TaxID=75743 RepID=UPI003B5A261D
MKDSNLWRRRQRQMVQTHFFRTASKFFGSPKSRLRIITAGPAPAQLRPRLWPRQQAAEVEEESGGTGQGEAAWGVANYTEWLSVRKRQRAELEMMADVKRWINSKISANDLELRVLETLERRELRDRDKTPTQQITLEGNALMQKKMSSTLIHFPFLEPDELLHEYGSVDYFQSRDRGKKGELSKDDLTGFEKSKLHHVDLTEECLLLRGEERSMACHSLPTTMAGEMGEATNTYRQRCLREYKKILEMCQYYGICFTERILEKALLHPGDKLKPEPALYLKLKQPGTGVLPANTVERRHTTRKQIALDQLKRGLAQRNGDVKMELELKNGFPKEVINGPEMNLRKLKMKLQPLPGLYPNTQANPRAFWPGHMLDKVRMYLPYAQLEHKEVLFSSTQGDATLSPHQYLNDKGWPISDQGYLTYGDIELNKRYWL